MKEIFLDTETIDLLEKEGDIMFQLCYLVDGKLLNAYTKPDNYKEMSIEAMEKTGITPEKLENLTEEHEKIFQEYWNYLVELLNNPDNVLYIHNAKYDLEVLKRKGLVPKCKVICTLKCMNVINDVLNLPYKSTRLSYLHYYFKNNLALSDEVNFHSADYDVKCLELLVQSMKNQFNFDIDVAVKITSNPIKYKYCHFGKNRGTPWSEMSYNQLKYYNELGDEDICYTLKNLI